jgi:hypothetical protein
VSSEDPAGQRSGHFFASKKLDARSPSAHAAQHV